LQGLQSGRFRGVAAQDLPALCHDPGTGPALVCELVDAARAIWALSGPGLQPMDHPAAVTADIGVVRDLPAAFRAEHGLTSAKRLFDYADIEKPPRPGRLFFTAPSSEH